MFLSLWWNRQYGQYRSGDCLIMRALLSSSFLSFSASRLVDYPSQWGYLRPNIIIHDLIIIIIHNLLLSEHMFEWEKDLIRQLVRVEWYVRAKKNRRSGRRKERIYINFFSGDNLFSTINKSQ